MPDMETKTQKAIALLANGEVKEAMKMFRSFRLGWSKDEKRTIDIACECLCGRTSFYCSLGIDCEKMIVKAVAILSAKYGIDRK